MDRNAVLELVKKNVANKHLFKYSLQPEQYIQKPDCGLLKPTDAIFFNDLPHNTSELKTCPVL